MQYEDNSQKQKDSHDDAVDRLKEQLKKSDSKEKELIDFYEKDKIDTQQKVKMAIEIYNKENETLKAAIHQKNHELQHLAQ